MVGSLERALYIRNDVYGCPVRVSSSLCVVWGIPLTRCGRQTRRFCGFFRVVHISSRGCGCLQTVARAFTRVGDHETVV